MVTICVGMVTICVGMVTVCVGMVTICVCMVITYLFTFHIFCVIQNALRAM